MSKAVGTNSRILNTKNKGESAECVRLHRWSDENSFKKPFFGFVIQKKQSFQKQRRWGRNTQHAPTRYVPDKNVYCSEISNLSFK
jgi:hypothetical protein